MKTFKTRHQFYLPDDLSKRLEGLAAKPGSSKTAILTDALRSWLDRKAGDELDLRFGARLDRQTRSSSRMEVRLDHVAAVLDLFVAHQMTLVAHQPPFDEATSRLGKTRYDRFMGQVDRVLTARSGKSSQPEAGAGSGD
ncbi:ribbon-helix-helix domain-containing protein [Sphingomonas oligophenolica]|uniref:Ribbon-helix-helix domain-containing protein n=1 Tax=Sphingomonas oligophenolica TaxID=301154 RepID=A0ABU9YAM6_9SPHN